MLISIFIMNMISTISAFYAGKLNERRKTGDKLIKQLREKLDQLNEIQRKAEERLQRFIERE